MKCPVLRDRGAVVWGLALLGLGGCVEQDRTPDVASTSIHESALASGWLSPLDPTGESQYWYSVACGSSAHVYGALYAADVSTPNGAAVYASHGGVIQFAGWSQNSHYGYLVIIYPGDSTGHSHYYGHLKNIDGWILDHVGSHVDPGQWLGNSTDSLHFHVETDQGVGVNLVGMTGFQDNPNNPYYPSNDGAAHNRCAWMSVFSPREQVEGAGCISPTCCQALDPTYPGTCP